MHVAAESCLVVSRYSRDNRVVGNDVSRYMSYMMDGGGIHTIGRSVNTTVAKNYFHDLASGEQCGDEPCHSVVSQSSICEITASC
jgi:hypothetical protein|eukprot:COSAG02_NODE_2022_length_10084_cov_2.725643_7_plen_85_part_00